MSARSLSDIDRWERHAETVLMLIRSALSKLRTSQLENDEPSLNREFYSCLLRANAESRKSGGPYFDWPPVYEGRVPPRPDTAGQSAETKQPDVQWNYIDHTDEHADESARSFAIECKRIGASSESGRSFNRQYVTDGVRRFIDSDWKYGNGVATGAMVGYIQSLLPVEILNDVNGALDKLGVPTLTLPTATVGFLTEMHQSLVRPFEVSPFTLVHLWVDCS